MQAKTIGMKWIARER